MANECLFVRDLLLALADGWKPSEDGKRRNQLVDKVVESLSSSRLRSLESSEIKVCFRDDGNRPVDMPKSGQFMILRGPDNEVPMVPVFGLDVDMEGSELKGLKVSLALYLRDDQNGTFSLKALGYRFEMSSGSGTHDFCHAQNVRQFNPATYLAFDTASWIPDSQPSFPLRARKPAELLVSALVAIYGTKVLDQLSTLIPGIRDYFK